MHNINLHYSLLLLNFFLTCMTCIYMYPSIPHESPLLITSDKYTFIRQESRLALSIQSHTCITASYKYIFILFEPQPVLSKHCYTCITASYKYIFVVQESQTILCSHFFTPVLQPISTHLLSVPRLVISKNLSYLYHNQL